MPLKSVLQPRKNRLHHVVEDHPIQDLYLVEHQLIPLGQAVLTLTLTLIIIAVSPMLRGMQVIRQVMKVETLRVDWQ